MASNTEVDQITALYNRVLGGRFTKDNTTKSEQQDATTSAQTGHPHQLSTSEDSPSTAKDSIPELKTVIQFEDTKGTHVIEFDGYTFTGEDQEPEAQESKESEEDLFKDFPILLKAVIGNNRSLEWRLEIQSAGLISIFRDIARNFKELDLRKSPVIIEHPFRCLFFLRDDLEKLSKDDNTRDTHVGLIQLLSFIKSSMCHQKDIEAYENLIVKTGKISFFMLWMLFPPYEPIIRCRPDQSIEDSQCFLLESIKPDFTNNGRPRWELSLLFGSHDGTEFDVKRKSKYIEYFDGFRFIDHHSMRFIPLRVLEKKSKSSIRDALIKRGKFYIDFCERKYSLWHYKGPAYPSDSGRAKDMTSLQATRTIMLNERVVVDRGRQSSIGKVSDDRGSFVAHCLNHVIPSALAAGKTKADSAETVTQKSGTSGGLSGFIPTGWTQAKGDWGDINPNGYSAPEAPKMEDDDYMICRNVTSAFALKQKIWVKMVNIHHFSEIVFNEDPFRSLQFPLHRKKFIYRLVEGFQKGKTGTYDDVIEGKGRGLIFLLYGPPGLGKTLTAESVAEVAKRPLYHISAGELSTNVSSLEDELRTIFRMGARWDAIVLLDEADVLMSKRTTDNLERNSVVAVFLRMLEYYRGMLFLTTNRRDDFDDAFFNRIHVTIEYTGLDALSRTNIWRDHLRRATKENVRSDLWTEEMYEILGNITLNGRDIKNYVRTAYAYSRATDGEDLGLDQVLIVLKNSLSGSGVPGSIMMDSSVHGKDGVLDQLENLAEDRRRG